MTLLVRASGALRVAWECVETAGRLNGTNEGGEGEVVSVWD